MSADPAAATSSNGAGPDGGGRSLRLGGMALRNGLLIHGPTSWAAAVRAPDGTIEVGSGPKPVFARGRLASIPLVRGPLRLAEALAVIPIARLNVGAARLPLEDRGVVAGALAGKPARGTQRPRRPPPLPPQLAGAVLGALPAIAALRDPDLAAYHGVEHKAIGGYEQGTDPADVPKEHQRCGSNLIVPMLALSIIGQLVVERLARKPGPLVRALAAAGGVGIAVELFAFAERNPGSVVGQAVHRPGYEIQRLLSTREPTPEQLEVGVAALSEVLRAEQLAADGGQGSAAA